MSYEEDYKAGIKAMKANLREAYGPDIDLYDTEEMEAAFTTRSFSSPFINVTRKTDNIKGTLQFSISPRVYFKFIAD